MRIDPDSEHPEMVAAFRAHAATIPVDEFLSVAVTTEGKTRKRKCTQVRSAHWLELLACFKYGWEKADE